MPLDPLQERIARTALSLPEAHTLALASVAAMIAHGFVTRVTKDIDLFTEVDDAEAIQIAASLRAALAQQNLDTRDAERPPLDHRFVAVDPASARECTVEVFADGGRLKGCVSLDIGPVPPTTGPRTVSRPRPSNSSARRSESGTSNSLLPAATDLPASGRGARLRCDLPRIAGLLTPSAPARA
ncbi:MAG: hypothetical protein LC799_28655 [Actinobacteria bacterium]|nr:hypothetical protein [Actinomycetota bacterium]